MFEGSAAVQLSPVQVSDRRLPITLPRRSVVIRPQVDSVYLLRQSCAARRESFENSKGLCSGRLPGWGCSMPRLSRAQRAYLINLAFEIIEACHGAHGERHRRALAWALSCAPDSDEAMRLEGVFHAAMCGAARGVVNCRDRARTSVAAQVEGDASARRGTGSG